MNAEGRHILVEYQICNPNVLNDLDRVEHLMRSAAKAAGATEVASIFHPFSPQGVSGVVVIEESHLSIHTWPEFGYASVDFFTCGDCVPEQAHQVLLAGLESKSSESMLIQRGMLSEPKAMRLVHHTIDNEKQSSDDYLVRRAV